MKEEHFLTSDQLNISILETAKDLCNCSIGFPDWNSNSIKSQTAWKNLARHLLFAQYKITIVQPPVVSA